MKRYTLNYVRMPGISPDHETIGKYVLLENNNGEWVRYKDYKKECRAEFGRGYSAGRYSVPAILGYDGYNCNCQDYMKIKIGKSCVGVGWFCPAHGYKERLNVEIQDRINKRSVGEMNRLEKQIIAIKESIDIIGQCIEGNVLSETYYTELHKVIKNIAGSIELINRELNHAVMFRET